MTHETYSSMTTITFPRRAAFHAIACTWWATDSSSFVSIGFTTNSRRGHRCSSTSLGRRNPHLRSRRMSAFTHFVSIHHTCHGNRSFVGHFHGNKIDSKMIVANDLPARVFAINAYRSQGWTTIGSSDSLELWGWTRLFSLRSVVWLTMRRATLRVLCKDGRQVAAQTPNGVSVDKQNETDT